jgi:hypothetical protein
LGARTRGPFTNGPDSTRAGLALLRARPIQQIAHIERHQRKDEHSGEDEHARRVRPFAAMAHFSAMRATSSDVAPSAL